MKDGGLFFNSINFLPDKNLFVSIINKEWSLSYLKVINEISMNDLLFTEIEKNDL